MLRYQCGRGEMLCSEKELGGTPSTDGKPNEAPRPGSGHGETPPAEIGRTTQDRNEAGDGRRAGRPACEYQLKLPAAAQIVRMVGVAAREIGATTSRPPEQALARLLAGHGGYMSLRAISAHEHMTPAARDEALATLCAQGLADIREIDPCGSAAVLTDEGARVEAEWRAELDRACEEAASALSPAEQQQLVALLFKMIGPR